MSTKGELINCEYNGKYYFDITIKVRLLEMGG